MKIIIAGAGAVGTHLAKLFSRDHQDCVLIDEDASRLGDLDSRYDIMTLQGRTTSINTMKDAGVEHADLFVGVTPDESRNMTACMIAHALGEAAGKINSAMMLGLVFIETTIIYALIVAILIIFVL